MIGMLVSARPIKIGAFKKNMGGIDQRGVSDNLFTFESAISLTDYSSSGRFGSDGGASSGCTSTFFFLVLDFFPSESFQLSICF